MVTDITPPHSVSCRLVNMSRNSFTDPSEGKFSALTGEERVVGAQLHGSSSASTSSICGPGNLTIRVAGDDCTGSSPALGKRTHRGVLLDHVEDDTSVSSKDLGPSDYLDWEDVAALQRGKIKLFLFSQLNSELDAREYRTKWEGDSIDENVAMEMVYEVYKQLEKRGIAYLPGAFGSLDFEFQSDGDSVSLKAWDSALSELFEHSSSGSSKGNSISNRAKRVRVANSKRLKARMFPDWHV